MSLKQKEYYFLTNRSTLFRYFVDNSAGKAQRQIFYPRKYQNMTDTQITKYERKLSLKFLWWSIFNKQKMLPQDRQICMSKIVDCTVFITLSLLLARVSRIFLFKQQFMALQNLMDSFNFDIKFWKALTAYVISFSIGYNGVKKIIRQIDLADLAIQYSPNFTDELFVPQVSQELKKFQQQRFPWLEKARATIS